MNSPDLLLHVNILHHIQTTIALLGRNAIIDRSRLLPPRELLFRDDRLASDAVEEIAALAGEALKVVGDVLGGEVGGGVAAVCFGFLFFPAGIEEFDCGCVLSAIISHRSKNMRGRRKRRGEYVLLMCSSSSFAGICVLQFGHKTIFCLFAARAAALGT